MELNQVFLHFILCGLLPKMSSFGVTEFNLAIEYTLRVRGKEKLTLKQAQRHAIYQIVKSALSAMIKHRE